ncbi:alpha-glucosidase C-terminal domain-containing protein [Olivibacter sp. SDN3]|uniref:alpha-amylase family glycosyl hydrolase n=1 Tax=Olivibacter sp. SDN3 TaxID=2764720 RepID=UPI0016518590|nr:alpha-amylase family glycosyl hydrolase [Olivibacter sp. SDN3]QNL48309.1 alpha-glucosidase C-terminal domain-containing protein [Olivibacter sp. SDN3]
MVQLKNLCLCFFYCLLFLVGCKSIPKRDKIHNEVIYHVFQRSFYDSNGDQHGDLNGIRLKLDYLQNLGVTSILLTPLYESVYYHNYYATDFEKIDPQYGTEEDYIALVKAIHERGMKIYMDMETQYITEDHLWWRDSYSNPASEYSDYIIYNDSAQTKPESIVFNLTELLGYDGTVRKITTVNLKAEAVKDYNIKLFKYWLDPNGDGNFDDGVDGFRLDHMMDDLDNKGILTNLFETFWVPLITELKAVNPNLRIMAEQADWLSYGFDYLERAGVDAVFAFRVQQATRTLDKAKIEAFADTTFGNTPRNKAQIMFIENHDIPRFAIVVDRDPGKLKVGAAINTLIGGIPSIYYGQEIGMLGNAEFGKYGKVITDANEIPSREAFEWYAGNAGEGMAIWYKDSGPWWDESKLKPHDGISLEEQENDSLSIWRFYQTLLNLRKDNHALTNGDYIGVSNDNKEVLTFLRSSMEQTVLVAVNLSSSNQKCTLDSSSMRGQNLRGIFESPENTTITAKKKRLSLPPYGLQIYEVK